MQPSNLRTQSIANTAPSLQMSCQKFRCNFSLVAQVLEGSRFEEVVRTRLC